MLDLLDRIAGYLTDPRGPVACAVATVISATGSAPRAVGTSMLVSETGEVTGSLSGGCVEGAVFEACREAIATGIPVRERYGVSDDGVAPGLPCGGSVDVLIQPVFPVGRSPVQQLRAEAMAFQASAAETAALVRRIDNGVVSGFVLPDPLEPGRGTLEERLAELISDTGMLPDASGPGAAAQAADLIRGGQTGLVRLAPGMTDCGDRPVMLLVESRLPPPRLFLFGANDFSASLSDSAQLLGYHVTLCDARPIFATRAAFPRVDEVVVEQPGRYLTRATASGLVDQRSVICVLTHDEKFDIPVLKTALNLDVAYVGAMGSRRTHDRRVSLLLEHGVDGEALARLHSPIGLDIGAVTPQEVAAAIVAELIAVRHGRYSVAPLNQSDGPIHGRQESSLVQAALEN